MNHVKADFGTLLRRAALLASASVIPLIASGCGDNAVLNGALKPETIAIPAMAGSMHGGQQPVYNATIQLWAVGLPATGGSYGGGQVPLITSQTIKTAVDGSFNITGDYTCPDNSYVYLTGYGGQPDGTGVNNSALNLMAALGPCASLSSSTVINMNEATTVAGVWALQQFATAATGTANTFTIGAPSTNVIGLQNAFAAVNNIAVTSTGVVPLTTTTAAKTINATSVQVVILNEQSKVDTLANILAACVNTTDISPGVTSSTCASLFNSVKPSGRSAVAADTLQAALDIAQNPSNPGVKANPPFSLISPTPPFQPSLSNAPNDYTLGLHFGSASVLGVTGSQSYLLYQGLEDAIDSAGNIYVMNGPASTTASPFNGITEISPSGIPIANFAAGSKLNQPRGFALDTANNIWVTNQASAPANALVEFTQGGAVNSFNYNAVGLYAIGIDGSNNVFVASNTASQVAELKVGTGTFTGLPGSTGAGPNTFAIDSSSNLWVANGGGTTVSRYPANCTASPCTYSAPTNFTNLTTPFSIVIDKNQIPWVSQQTNTLGATNVVVKLDPASPTSGGTATTAKLGGIQAPLFIATDGASNVWVANSSPASVTELQSGSTTVALSPSAGFAHTYAGPKGIAVDLSGNVWITNSAATNVAGSYVLTEIVGAGAPAVQPLSRAVALGKNRSASLTAVAPGSHRAAIPPQRNYVAVRRSFSAGGIGYGVVMLMRKPWCISRFAMVAFSLIFCAGAASAQSGIASLTPGIISGLATGLSGPKGLAFDSAGNLYIAESGASRVRKVTPAGVITTFAGTGTSGNSGNGGQATSAALNGPSALAFDAAGNLYIAENPANDVRKVDINGVITLFAGAGTASSTGDGGLATAATLNAPGGLAVDLSGNVYIVEITGSRVRKVTGGIISRVAGTGTAGFSGDGGLAVLATLYQPHGIAVDAIGNLYIADYVNSKIRMVNGAGIISTIAGTTTGFSGDGGLATSAQLDLPRAVNLDAAGNLYIADGVSNRIRKIDVNHIITTVAGGATASTLCATQTDTLKVGNGCVALQASLNLPLQAVVDSASNIYIVDNTGANNQVREVTVRTSILNFVNQAVGSTSGLQSATLSNTGSLPLQLTGLAITGATFIQTSSGGTDCSATTTLGVGSSCQIAVLFTPSAVTAFTGTLTITDNSQGTANTTQTIQLNGAGVLAAPLVKLTVNPTTTGPSQPVTFSAVVTGAGSLTPTGTVQFLNGATIIGQGSLTSGTATYSSSTLTPGTYSVTASYLGDSNYTVASSTPAVSLTVNPGAPTIITVTASTGIAAPGQSVVLSAAVAQIAGAVYPTGSVTFMDGTTSVGTVVLTAGQAQITTTAFGYGANSITAFYSGDYVFSADYSPVTTVTIGTPPLATITPGLLSTLAGTGTAGFAGQGTAAAVAQFNQPVRTAIDSAGDIYVADSINDVVREISPSGIITTVAGTVLKSGYSGDNGQATSALLNGPRGVALDPSGNLYILDAGNNVIRRVTPAGIITTFAGVASTTAQADSGDKGAANIATLNTPRGIATDTQGNLYIAESVGNVIRKVDTAGIITRVAGIGSAGLSGNGAIATPRN